MRIPSKFFKPLFPAMLGSTLEDGRKLTLADIKPWPGYRCLRATAEEQALEDEALELWKGGNRVAYWYYEGQRWVNFKEFCEIVDL